MKDLKEYLMSLDADALIALMNKFAHHIEYDGLDVILPTNDEAIINIDCEFFHSIHPLYWKDEIHEIVDFELEKMSADRRAQLEDFIND